MYFFISKVKFFYQTIQDAQDDHAIQLKLGVVKQKSHFFIKFYKSLISAGSVDQRICTASKQDAINHASCFVSELQ